MLKFALCGGYVNFGVFRFYGDVALDDALNTFVKMLLSVPQSDLLVSIFFNQPFGYVRVFTFLPPKISCK